MKRFDRFRPVVLNMANEFNCGGASAAALAAQFGPYPLKSSHGTNGKPLVSAALMYIDGNCMVV